MFCQNWSEQINKQTENLETVLLFLTEIEGKEKCAK